MLKINENEKVIISMIADRLESLEEVQSLFKILHVHTQNQIRRLIPNFVLNEFDDGDKENIIKELRKLAE